MIDVFAGTLATLGLCAACCALGLHAYRRTSELLSPWTLFLLMSVLDVFLPATLFLLGAPLGVAPWAQPLTPGTVTQATLVFTCAGSLFGAGYLLAARVVVAGSEPPVTTAFSGRRAYLVLAIAVALYAFYVGAGVVEAGSVGGYYTDRLARRFRPFPMSGPGPVLVFLYQLGASMLPVIFLAIGTLFVRRRGSPFVRGILLPAAGLLLAMTTLFRGVLLTYFIGLAILETARFKDSLAQVGEARAASRLRRFRRRLVVALAGGVLCFSLYGTVRNFYTARAWGGEARTERALMIEIGRTVRGEGLVGLSSILHAYPAQVPFLHGKTITDMLLLPVPRAIWRSKPPWYGITDITLAMGWPASTMSPVTMPGELYANFGYIGLCFMAIYGLLFGAAASLRASTRFRYAYAFAVVPAMLPTFWMGFTGLVNNFLPIPLLVAASLFILPGARRELPLVTAPGWAATAGRPAGV